MKLTFSYNEIFTLSISINVEFFMHCCTVSSGYSATFFAASKQRNSNSVQGIFMYETFNTPSYT
jgi:hypothetical protein